MIAAGARGRRPGDAGRLGHLARAPGRTAAISLASTAALVSQYAHWIWRTRCAAISAPAPGPASRCSNEIAGPRGRDGGTDHCSASPSRLSWSPFPASCADGRPKIAPRRPTSRCASCSASSGVTVPSFWLGAMLLFAAGQLRTVACRLWATCRSPRIRRAKICERMVGPVLALALAGDRDPRARGAGGDDRGARARTTSAPPAPRALPPRLGAVPPRAAQRADPVHDECLASWPATCSAARW